MLMSKSETSRTDPGDRQFGAAAADKEEELDQALRHGTEDRLAEEPDAESPRAAGKAVPDRTNTA